MTVRSTAKARQHTNPQEGATHATILLHKLVRSEAASVRGGGQARSSRARGGAGVGMLGEGGGVVGHELWPEYPRVTRLRHDVVVRDVGM